MLFSKKLTYTDPRPNILKAAEPIKELGPPLIPDSIQKHIVEETLRTIGPSTDYANPLPTEFGSKKSKKSAISERYSQEGRATEQMKYGPKDHINNIANQMKNVGVQIQQVLPYLDNFNVKKHRKPKQFHLNDCILSYISSAIFICGIATYIYYMLIDYKDETYKNRTDEKQVWVWGLLVLMICGFFIVSYCLLSGGIIGS